MKILFITPNSTDPLSFYRGTGPLFRLRQDHKDFDYTDTKQISWAEIAGHDLVFMQRPYKPEHLQIAQICKRWGTPLVVDYDDWLLDLPEANPAYDHFNATKQFVIEITNLADGITVATEELADLHRAIGGKDVTVVPNAYDSRLFSYRQQVIERNRIVAWRGGNSHMEDLMHVAGAFTELAKKHTNWQFLFIAQKTWFLPKLPNIHNVEGSDVLDYFKKLYDIAPAILTHPLTDCTFNRAKSMCSWLEATHARAAFVGPDFKEYQRPGVTNYKAGDAESFFSVLDGLIQSPAQIIENFEKAEVALNSEFELRNVNEIRYKVFSRLAR